MMRRRRSLRVRVALAFAAFGAGVSLLLAAGLYIVARDIGQRLLEESLEAELDDYLARRARNPNSLPPNTASLRGYVLGHGEPPDKLPPPVRALPAGVHDISLDGVPYRVAAAELAGERIVILFDETRQRAREQRFLGYLGVGVLVMTVLSAAGGLWLAGRVIAPVTELAIHVTRADPRDPEAAAALGRALPSNEIGDALAQYLERLHGFIQRERAFTADVSHELRTPVAVIQGAVEVLEADPMTSPQQRERLKRIERSAHEMAMLIRALLLLAREETTGESSEKERCDLAAVVRDTVDKHRHLLRKASTSIDLEILAEPLLAAPSPLVSVVVANLVRNAFSYTAAGRISIRLDSTRLEVSDTGPGMSGEDLAHLFERHYRGALSEGSGIGLSLAKRICDRFGWTIAVESGVGRGTIVRLIFRGLPLDAPLTET